MPPANADFAFSMPPTEAAYSRKKFSGALAQPSWITLASFSKPDDVFSR